MSALQIEREERGVVHLILNREAKRNAFDDALIAEINAALRNLANARDVKIIVLRGHGKVFCAGADLQWMQSMARYTLAENQKDADALAELMYQLNAMPQATIALVQGAAFAGGMGLLSCCDLVLAAPDAQFCLSEVKLGLIPAVIAPFILARIGEKAMRRYALTAERFDAKTAKNLGLIDEIVEAPELLLSRAEYFIEQLLTNSPNAIALMKNLLRKIIGPSLEIREQCVQAIAECRVSVDAQQRMHHFLHTRKN